MRRRKRTEPKVESNMTAMIDVVFQLLTFFMFTLRPMIHEGQFVVNMAAAGESAKPQEEFVIPPLAVHLKAGADGSLDAILLGERVMRNFEDLRIQVQSLAGGVLADEVEAEIHADDSLQYLHLVSAVNSLTAARISKINFAAAAR